MDIPVGLIGFGFAGRTFHAPLIASTPGLALAVVGSRRGNVPVSRYPGVSIVSDPLAAARHPAVDLVVIATPNDSHVPLAEAALAAGKHVVVDKPFTVKLSDARRLSALASAAGRVLSVFQNRRFDSDFLGIAREIERGRAGHVVELRSEMSRYRPEVRDRWRERPEPGSGIWYDLGPHLIDQAMVLFGPPDSVFADLRIQRRGGETVDWFHAVLGCGDTRVVLSSGMLAADGGTRFVLRGTGGSLIKERGDRQEQQLIQEEVPGAPGWGDDPDPMRWIGPGGETAELAAPPGDYRRYYESVRDAIGGKGQPAVTPAQACAVMAVIEAGLRSAAEGRVEVPEYTEAEQRAWLPCAGSDRTSG